MSVTAYAMLSQLRDISAGEQCHSRDQDHNYNSVIQTEVCKKRKVESESETHVGQNSLHISSRLESSIEGWQLMPVT